ncbi:hypothetical protein BCT61_17310 [Vibrio breoganii]|nr:hypothetical protein BCT61_17310 [Vibrio breoganii]
MTQPLGKNFGGMMQAYALQRAIETLGHDVVTIDRQVDYPIGLKFHIKTLLNSCYKILGKRTSPSNIVKHYDYIYSNGRSFVERNIKVTDVIRSSLALEKHFQDNQYDAVIVGSDQTWRPRYSPNIYDYFLEFLDNNLTIKKIAYASSFGVDTWEYTEEQSLRCRNAVKFFESVSVRELTGVDLCKKHLKVDVDWTLDPTLIVQREVYDEILPKKESTGEPSGVYTYFLDKTESKVRLSEIVAETLQTYVYDKQAKCSINEKNASLLDDFKMPKPEEWLQGFRDARYVITDSFHGMVFSLVFQKPFYVIANKNRGLARFESLLKSIGLEDRIIMNIEEFDMGKIEYTIDYNQVNKKLNEMRHSSIKFLKSALDN